MPASEAPASVLRRAAALMNERADAMDAEMDRMPATWEPGYRDEVRASLGGPAGEMAAPWDQETTRAVADWLDALAEQAGQSGNWALHSLSPGPLKLALAYLGESERNDDAG